MSLDQFFDREETLYNFIVDVETRKRIRISVAAYAYELLSTPILSDEEFDALAYSIDLKISTRRPDLDAWFRRNFEPHTGMWIYGHPEKSKLSVIAKNIINSKS
jgi:hypothetical protein